MNSKKAKRILALTMVLILVAVFMPMEWTKMNVTAAEAQYVFDASTESKIAGIDKSAVVDNGTYGTEGYFTLTGPVTRGNSNTISAQLGKGAAATADAPATAGGELKFTVTGTADVTISATSTGGSNTSNVVLVKDGSQRIKADGADSELNEVTGTGVTQIQYTGLQAGNYSIAVPIESEYNRGVRITKVAVTQTSSDEPSVSKDVKVSVDTVEAKQGDKSVQVGVRVENPDKVNIGALVLEVTWDKAVLKATNAVAGAMKLSEDATVNTERMAEGFIAYADASATGLTTEGEIITMTFDVLDDAKVELAPINVKVLSAASATSQGGNMAPALDVKAVNGGINVLEQSVVQTNLKASVDTIDAKKGDKNVQVGVHIQNPDKVNIGALVLEVTWDKAVLKATNAVAGAMKLSESPTVNTERIAEGFIGYADASATGLTTEGEIITMTFDVLDDAKVGLAPINVKVLSAASATSQGDNIAPALDVKEVNGGINVSEKEVVKKAIKVSVDKLNAKQGDKNVQVSVQVENPDKVNIGAMALQVTWDKAALKATNAVAGDMKLSDSVTINTDKMAEGFIGYADASATGVTTEGKIMVITFEVLQSAKTGLTPIDVKVLSAASAEPEGSDFAPLITDITEVDGSINIASSECTHANVKDSDYKVIKAPTYKEEGIAEAVCPDCGTKLTRPIAKLVCTHANVKDSDYKVVKAPTYKEEGTAEAICPDCGEKLTRTVAKLVCTHANVKDSDYKVVKEPTYTEEGIEEAICPDCGEKLTRPIPVKKIKYGDVNSDGEIDIQDSILLKKHLARRSGLTINLQAADVNVDGEVNIQDAVVLLKYLAHMDVTLGK